MLTPSEHARHGRAELETIASALRAHQLAQLIALARKLLDDHDAAHTQECEWGTGERAPQSP